MARDKKRIREIVELPKGYSLVRLNNSHYGIECPDGERLRDARGMPIQLPFSPKWVGNYKHVARRVMAAIEEKERAS